MQTKKVALVLLASMLIACGDRSIGDDNNNVNDNNSNVNENQNNVVPDLLTRRDMLIDSLELMGYDLDLGPGCVSPATDVFPEQNPEDEKLCWALYQGMDMELVGIDATGTFRPEDAVMHVEMWRVVTQLMGYADLPPDGQTIPASDLDLDSWYIGSALSLLITRNWEVVFVDENGLANPANATTNTEWFQAKQMFQNELLASGSITREHLFEMIVSIFYNSRYTEIPCQGNIFPDVPANTMLCYTSTLLADEGIVQGMQDGLLHPYETTNWAETAKLIVEASVLEPVETGCSGAEPGVWYTPYMDAICEVLEGLPDYMVPTEAPANRSVVLQTMFAVRAATSTN